MAILSTAAILLRAHAYSETSRILRFLSRDAGVVSAMARGVRRPGARSAPGLDTFAQGDLTLYVREGRDLQTLKEFSITQPRRALGRDPLKLAAAGVLGELVLRHGGEGGDAALFDQLAASLDALGAAPSGEVAHALLYEGWATVVTLGYQPQLDVCPRCGRALSGDGGEAPDEGDAQQIGRFDFEAAGVRCASCSVGSAGPRLGPIARRQLAQLLEGDRPADLARVRTHLRLLSDFITYHVAGTRPLEAFRIFAALMPPDTRDESVDSSERTHP